MSTAEPITLPICTVQHDFESLVADVSDGLVPDETFWASCYKTGAESVHGKVRLALNERNRNVVDFSGVSGVEFKTDSQSEFVVACPALAIPFTKLAIANTVFSEPLPKSKQDNYRKISAFDIAPDGSQFATGYDDGTIYIVSTTTPQIGPTIAQKCHLSTITSLRFFPSSRVLLSASADFSLAVLPAEPLPSDTETPKRIAPVRTFKGHARSVTSAGIVSRGRNVVSGSRDGTVRLWDVSSGAQIRTMGTYDSSGVLSLSLGDRGEGSFSLPPDGEGGAPALPDAPHAIDPREVETNDKLVFCGLASGSLEVFDLSTKLAVHRSSPSMGGGQLHSIAYNPMHNLVATGSGRGAVTVFDTRSMAAPLVSFSRNSASIEDIAFVTSPGGDVGLAVATEDGLPYVANVRPEGPSVRAELVGTDCDAVRCIRVGPEEGTIWTAGDDGIIRRHSGLHQP